MHPTSNPAAAVLLLLFGALLPCACNSPPAITPEDLARRMQESQPSWESYEEDIKAQIGAALAAQWQGEPIEARRDGRRIEIAFRLSGPWAARRAAIPILLRDSHGDVSRNASCDVRDGLARYTFELPEWAAKADLPWVEVKCPGYKLRRLAFTHDGRWTP